MISSYLSGSRGHYSEEYDLFDKIFSKNDVKILMRNWKSVEMLMPVDKIKNGKDILWSSFLRWCLENKNKSDKKEAQMKNQTEKLDKKEIPLIKFSEKDGIYPKDVKKIINEKNHNQQNRFIRKDKKWEDLFNSLENPLPNACD